jgi:hypothetical protein
MVLNSVTDQDHIAAWQRLYDRAGNLRAQILKLVDQHGISPQAALLIYAIECRESAGRPWPYRPYAFKFERGAWCPTAKDGSPAFDPWWQSLPCETRPSYDDFAAAYNRWQFTDDKGPYKRGWDIGRLKGVWDGGDCRGHSMLFLQPTNNALGRLIDATTDPARYANLIWETLSHVPSGSPPTPQAGGPLGEEQCALRDRHCSTPRKGPRRP